MNVTLNLNYFSINNGRKLVHECDLFMFIIKHSCFIFNYQRQASLYLSSNGQEVLNVNWFCSQVTSEQVYFLLIFFIHAKYSSNTDALTFHRVEAIDKSCEYCTTFLAEVEKSEY